MKNYKILFDAIEAKKDAILEAERHIWKHPETGFKEWKTHAYLKKLYEDLGYELVEAGNIPGFYVDIDTGIPGPKIAIFGELDSLIVSSHPERDPETCAVHACGHNCQSAALYGIAAALKAPGALDGLSGSIRLIAVPAEEGIEIAYRQSLRKEGVIRYLSGKLEFIYRGILDGVDLAMMVHTSPTANRFQCNRGSNGSMTKTAIFRGKSAHAGGSPHKGINALYAATTALSAANAIRETFQEKDTIRFHPIITKGGTVVNAIPDEVTTEAYIRGATIDAIKEASDKINRAFAGCAAAMGCTVEFVDEHGYGPRNTNAVMKEAFHTIASMFYSEEEMSFNDGWGTACSDMGDVSCIIPSIHPGVGGAAGAGHGSDYQIVDPYNACVNSAKIQVGVAALLLSEDAKLAKLAIAEAKVPYGSKEEYLAVVDSIYQEETGVIYNEDGTITLKYSK